MDINQKATITNEKHKTYNDYKDRTNIIPNATTYEVPENAKYLSDFLDDLPHNCFFNKVVTGCGGTTLALTNKENYVVTVHSLNVVKNKSLQHSNILGVHGEMSNDAIIKYLFDYSDKPKKFIVTYDSLPRLIDVIENNSKCEVSDFRLLVDEVQVLIRNLGEFKIEVSNNLLNNVYKFKSICYLTATPTNLRYLPEPIKKLDYIDLEWPNLEKVNINHCRVGKQFQLKLTSFIIDQYENNDNDIYVFYNSKFGVTTIINHLCNINSDLKYDIEIIFADNEGNKKYFKKYLNKSIYSQIKLGYSLEVDLDGNPVDVNRKRIKFISSFGFEGVDFYSFGRDVTTIIAADAASKSMRYDISIDIPQILGRIRRDKTTGKFPKNNIYFIWKTMADVIDYKSEDDALDKISSKTVLYSTTLDNAIELNTIDNGDSVFYKEMEPYIISVSDNQYIKNMYVMEAIMSTYMATHVDYHVNYNTGADNSCNIVNSLRDILTLKDINSFSIPDLSHKNKIILDKKISFKSAAEEYYNIYNKYIASSLHNIDRSEINEELKNIRKSHDLLDDALNYMDIDQIIKLQCHNTKIKQKIQNVEGISNISNNIHLYNIKSGDLLKSDECIFIIKKMLTDNDISSAPSISFLKNFFKVSYRSVDNERHVKLSEKK